MWQCSILPNEMTKRRRNDQKTRIVENDFSVIPGSPVRLDGREGALSRKL